MPIYRTRLFETNPKQGPGNHFVSRTWKARLRNLVVVASDITAASEITRRHHHSIHVVAHKKVGNNRIRLVYAPEIIIEAKSRSVAQMAANMIVAAKTLLDGSFFLGELMTVVADRPSDDTDLSTEERSEALSHVIPAHGYELAVELAAKATRKRRLTYTLIKYWLSMKICSVPPMTTHPAYGTKFGLERDPFNHVVMAQAIVAAYSVVEEIGVSVRSSANRPSKTNETWDPQVLAKLQDSLKSRRIDPSETCLWLNRMPLKRIARKHPVPAGQEAPWAEAQNKDRIIPIVDAIHYCGMLRNKISAHTFGHLTYGLTMYDVANVQGVARHLTLSALGALRP
jgi:hypothetical protein